MKCGIADEGEVTSVIRMIRIHVEEGEDVGLVVLDLVPAVLVQDFVPQTRVPFLERKRLVQQEIANFVCF